MDFVEISMREFVAEAAGSRRFNVKHMPQFTLRPELHTEASRETGLFCLADDTSTFILQNRWVGGDVWSEALNGYTDAVWETVVLRSAADMFEKIMTGPDSSGRFEWSDGIIAWNTVAVELLLQDGDPATFAVGGVLAHTISLNGALHEFLVELELAGPVDDWRLMRSAMGPSGFTLARHTPPLHGPT